MKNYLFAKTKIMKCHRLYALALAAILLLGLGCAGGYRPAESLPAVSLAHYAGTPISAAEPSEVAVDSTDALDVQVQAVLMAVEPKQVFKPFAAESRIVTSTGTDSPLLASPSSLAGARYAIGEDAVWFDNEVKQGSYGGVKELGRFAAVLPRGVSVRLTVRDGSSPGDFSDIRMLQVIVHRPALEGQSLKLGIVKQGPPPNETAEPSADQPATSAVVRETIVGNIPSPGKNAVTVGLIVPVQFAGGRRQAVFAIIKIGGWTPADAHQAAIARMKQDLARPVPVAGPTFEQMLVRNTLRTMDAPQTRRAAIAYLAGQSQAGICGDVALVADAATLEQLAKDLKVRLGDGASTASLATIGWAMDQTAFDLMGRLYIQKKLSLELSAVLVTTAGEGGRSAASLEQVTGRAASRRDLENRLLAENYIYLEDVSPAARVRAYDWLRQRGKGPAGYDPLGPVADRKKALDAAISEMLTPANHGESK